MVIENVTDPVSAAIHARLGNLRAAAAMVVDRYWQAVYAGEKGNKGWENNSCLTVRLKESQYSFSVLWGRIEWRGSKAKGTRTVLRHHIAKGKESSGYNMGRLKSYARDWEKEIVEATESELALIREEVKFLSKALQIIRYANLAQSKRENYLEKGQ